MDQQSTRGEEDSHSQGHQTKKGGADFLALELFDPAGDHEDPEAILNEFRDPFDLKCYGQTRWFF